MPLACNFYYALDMFLLEMLNSSPMIVTKKGGGVVKTKSWYIVIKEG